MEAVEAPEALRLLPSPHSIRGHTGFRSGTRGSKAQPLHRITQPDCVCPSWRPFGEQGSILCGLSRVGDRTLQVLGRNPWKSLATESILPGRNPISILMGRLLTPIQLRCDISSTGAANVIPGVLTPPTSDPISRKDSSQPTHEQPSDSLTATLLHSTTRLSSSSLLWKRSRDAGSEAGSAVLPYQRNLQFSHALHSLLGAP